jgi:D-threo-aldose 1-dehydrogenase
MKTRRLGRTNLTVSEIGMGGAWLLGRRSDLPLDNGIQTIRHALDLGINYLDTAECYIGGRSEEVFGAALEGYSGAYTLATKCGHRVGSAAPRSAPFDWTRHTVLESLDVSLSRLGRTSVDVFQLHTPEEPSLDAIFGPGGAVEGMREARERGLIRFLGITGRDLEFLTRCVESDAFDTLIVFQRFDLLEQSALALFRAAQAHDVGVILGSPLRLGLFGSARDELLARCDDDDRAQVTALEALLGDEPGGVTASAIRFALSHESVSVVLSGAASPAEIESAVTAADRPLPAELTAEIYRLGAGEVRAL